jgi:hypothetical protein
MKRHAFVLLALLGAGLPGGCGDLAPGTTRELGDAEFDFAFAEAREVMSQYFELASVDPDAGEIRSAPAQAEAGPERLLGRSNARQVATMRVYRKGGQIVAQASVAVQRQADSIHRGGAGGYDSVPHETPAEIEAATSAEQNELWRTERHDRGLESRILADLYRRLHPVTTQPE